jgi:hypothetical protein
MMDESYRDDIPQVTAEENELLVAEFMEEIRGAIFQINHNTTPLLMAFLQSFIRYSRM